MSTFIEIQSDNLKKMIDGAIARGLFSNAETVEAVMSSFRHLKEYALKMERGMTRIQDDDDGLEF